jgi:hypothetical protein
MKTAVITEDVLDVAPLETQLLESIAERALVEISRQDMLARARRFGGTHILPSGPNVARLGVLTEEVGEVAKECNEELMADPAEAKESAQARRHRLQTELIQVAACAVAWATALEEGR